MCYTTPYRTYTARTRYQIQDKRLTDELHRSHWVKFDLYRVPSAKNPPDADKKNLVRKMRKSATSKTARTHTLVIAWEKRGMRHNNKNNPPIQYRVPYLGIILSFT